MNDRLCPNLACPWCGEPDYDLVGLKSHVIKGECEAFEAIGIIRNPFADGMARIYDSTRDDSTHAHSGKGPKAQE